MKIKKINASFSLKKSLGNYEMADIFFAAEAELGTKDKADDVAKKVHDFCKKLAVEKYNAFSRYDIQADKLAFVENQKKVVPKEGQDPNEAKEVAAEMTMDAKVENNLDPF